MYYYVLVLCICYSVICITANSHTQWIDHKTKQTTHDLLHRLNLNNMLDYAVINPSILAEQRLSPLPLLNHSLTLLLQQRI